MKSISWITKVMTLSLMLVTIVPLASETMTTASAAIHDELEDKKIQLRADLERCMAHLEELLRLLQEKATEDEAPELYNQVMELKAMTAYTAEGIERATTEEELADVEMRIQDIRVKLDELYWKIENLFDFTADTVDGIKMMFRIINEEDKTVEVTGIGSHEANCIVTIPETVNSYTVIGIGEEAFYDSNIGAVVIPQTMTTIGYAAFCGCNNLTGVYISDLNGWYNVSFNNATSNPLGYAHHLYLNGVEVKELVIPNTMTSIGSYVFQGCLGLSSVVIGNSVTSIGRAAFEGCSNMTNLTISSSVTNIGHSAFSGCSSLTDITIPNSVISIEGHAFFGCAGLTSLTIPNSVLSIEENLAVFGGCSNLTTIFVEQGNPKYDSRDNCNAIIETASNTLIASCKNSTIPNSITSLGRDAFAWCYGLTNIFIPSSVTSIGGYAFYKSTDLTSVIVDSKTPIAISWSTFDNRSNMTLYVPTGSKAAYEQADYWKDFKEIIELPAPHSYDVDGNGEVNVNDVNSLIDKILDQVSVADDNDFAYDVNQDGEVNIADVTLLVNRINYLERVTTLESGSADEVRTVLEQMSGTLQTDAREVASVIKENPNVEDAYTEDGDNLIVKHKDSDEVVVYPMYKMMAPFSDLQVPELPNQTTMLRAPRKAAKQYPKVAIFNFFEDMSPYKVQNLITRSVEKYFLTNGYDVDYYTPNNVRDEYKFTYDNLASVLYQSKNYAAIIIMTHGAQVNGGSYLCTGEVAGRNDRNMYNWADDKYYKMYSADLQAESNCILYLGICDSRKNDGFDSMSPTIGYSGPTCMAQANAAMLFYLMLEEGYSLEEALSVLPSEPSPNENTKVCKSNNVGSQMLESETYQKREYMQDCSVDYLLRNNGDYSYAGGVFTANDDKMSFFAWVEFVPILWYDVNWQEDFYDYLPHLKHPANVENGAFSADFNLRKLPESIYICRITGLTKSKEKKLIKPSKYRFRICSQNFKENSANVNTSDESITAPLILDADGKVVDEITLALGSSTTFTLDAYSGHTFETPCLDTNVATVSLSGTTLTVTGVSEGTTYFGVYDVQNRQTAVVMVTVEPGSGNHDWVDLGLPSGTLWASCNVGASSPGEYGGYYTFEEAQEFNPPTLDQIKELIDNTTSEWTTLNGVNGRKFTGSNGGTIFLPAAGSSWDGELDDVGSDGNYWSSTPAVEFIAYELYFYSGGAYWNYYYGYRGNGRSVRPVRQN